MERTDARWERLGPRVFVVLGGGGIRGLAHVGAWQALVEAGVPVAGVLGTSIGALVGACVAGGMGWDEMVRLSLSLDRREIARVNRKAVWVNGIREPGLFRDEPLRAYIERVLPVRDWAGLTLPLQVNAVRLATGETAWFGHGARADVLLPQAVYASAALPVFYPPARIGGEPFVDGGVTDPLPLGRAVELGATGIVAVDVGAGREADADRIVEEGMLSIAHRVLSIASRFRREDLLAGWSSPPLIYVRPRVGTHPPFAFGEATYFIEEGYRATRAALAAEAGAGGGGGVTAG